MGLDIAEFVIAVEDEFGVDILERDASYIDTFESLVNYLERATANAPHSQAEADRVLQVCETEIQTFFTKDLRLILSS